MLAQFSPEQLAASKELFDLITAATSRKKPVKRKPKAKLLPVPKWVKERYSQERIKYYNRVHATVIADGHSIPKEIPKDFTNTNDISDAIVEIIKWNGGAAERIMMEGRVIEKDGKFIRIKTSGTVGTADISGTFRGRKLAIEVKNKYTKDKVSDAQEKYRKVQQKAGALHLYAIDMETFFHWWDNSVMVLPDLELF
jgi:hypothetical protein